LLPKFPRAGFSKKFPPPCRLSKNRPAPVAWGIMAADAKNSLNATRVLKKMKCAS